MCLDKETTRQEVYFVKGLNLVIVRLPAIEALNVATKVRIYVYTINTNKETIVSRFPKLFSGFGCLTEEYEFSSIRMLFLML